MPGLEWQSYVYNLLGHAIVAFGGFFLFGGWKLFARPLVPRPQWRTPCRTACPTASPKAWPIRIARPRMELPLEFRHWLTMGVVAALILSVIFFEVNVGMGAFVGAVILVLARAADDTVAIKAMPWGVIVMVCGVTVLIALLEKTQGIELLVSLIARLSTAESVTAVVALITGLVSVYASTSGVVLPAFLPVVPGLALTLGRHRCVRDCAVDERRRAPGRRVAACRPSARCASRRQSAGTDTRKLFNQMLAWGLSMCVVGAVVCYVMFA